MKSIALVSTAFRAGCSGGRTSAGGGSYGDGPVPSYDDGADPSASLQGSDAAKTAQGPFVGDGKFTIA